MNTLKLKLALSALGIALVATPALAQSPYRHAHPRRLYDYRAQAPVGVYPNPVTRDGSAEQAQSGAAFNLGVGY
jgi:hypothetical protein